MALLSMKAYADHYKSDLYGKKLNDMIVKSTKRSDVDVKILAIKYDCKKQSELMFKKHFQQFCKTYYLV